MTSASLSEDPVQRASGLLLTVSYTLSPRSLLQLLRASGAKEQSSLRLDYGLRVVSSSNLIVKSEQVLRKSLFLNSTAIRSLELTREDGGLVATVGQPILARDALLLRARVATSGGVLSLPLKDSKSTQLLFEASLFQPAAGETYSVELWLGEVGRVSLNSFTLIMPQDDPGPGPQSAYGEQCPSTDSHFMRLTQSSTPPS